MGPSWHDVDGPEPLGEWVRAGFRVSDAEAWRSWRFKLAAADAWRKAGIEEALHAAQWSTARATPDDVGEWKAAGIEATEAVQWHELGFDLARAKEAKRQGRKPTEQFDQQRAVRTTNAGPGGSFEKFREAGVQPQILHSYFAQQWLDDEALEWARQQVDASDARLWKELGVGPGEASRLMKSGATVASVVREWWSAGIPLDEVAEWLGAGLTAAEAVQQRSRGITAEQAAALRALRDDEN